MNSLKYFIPAIGILLLLSSCSNTKNAEEKTATPTTPFVASIIKPDSVINITLDDTSREQLKTEGKKMAYAAQFALARELKLAIKRDGVEGAVTFCSDRAMQITDSISVANQAEIKRIALKNRNPENKMDNNETILFKQYIVNYINGAPAYPSLSWDENANPVYYYPIYTKALCLNCHGTAGKEVLPEVAERIKTLYPDDLAMNFEKGDPRGLWKITMPGYRITDFGDPQVVNQKTLIVE